MTVCAECGGPVDPDVTHPRHDSDCPRAEWGIGWDCYCSEEVCACCCSICRWQIDNFDLPDRITTKIEVDPISGCWLWTGAISGGTGYGSFYQAGKKRGAHRVVYQLLVGPIPSDLELDHLCSVRHCVNPGHLEPVTHRENVLRGRSAAASLSVATHCLRGHEFTAENTYVRPSGWRQCRACKRIHQARYAASRRARAVPGAEEDPR